MTFEYAGTIEQYNGETELFDSNQMIVANYFIRAARESMQKEYLNNNKFLKNVKNLHEEIDIVSEQWEETCEDWGKVKEENTALKKQLSEARDVIEFYSEESPECVNDYERVCSDLCPAALVRSGHHSIHCDQIYGKRARTYLEKYPKGEE